MTCPARVQFSKVSLSRYVAFAAAFLCTLPQSAEGQARETVDVFFVGNSYIYYNNLPGQLEAMSESLAEGPVLRTAHHLHGGFTLRRHLEDGHLPDALAQPTQDGAPWDVVVLQEQSRIGAPYANEEFGTIGDTEPFFEAAAEVVDLILGLGARPVFYMTWAKEVFPGQADPIADAYDSAGAAHGADVAAAGIAWARVREERPDIQLFDPDGSHPSPAGTYLVASVMYSTLTGRSAVGAPRELHGRQMQTPGVFVSDDIVPLVRLPHETARYLQSVAWETVEGRRRP
jgi:hypothetical protein